MPSLEALGGDPCAVAHMAAVSSQWCACHNWSECALLTLSVKSQLNNRVLLQVGVVQPVSGMGGEGCAGETQNDGTLIAMNPWDQKCLLTEVWMTSVVTAPVN